MSNKQNDIFREGTKEVERDENCPQHRGIMANYSKKCICKTSEKVWNDAIYSSYVSKIRSILIPLTDELGWDDSKKHRDAFDKAFGELTKLLTNI